MIQECLGIWARSPSAYKQLKSCKMLILPSVEQLIMYKNTVRQTPGINPMMFDWMLKEAERLNLSQEGRFGGIMFDEMSIQVNIH